MRMNESEAMTKWCPFVRLEGIARTHNNRQDNAKTRCLGSGCMVFREDDNGDVWCGLAGAAGAGVDITSLAVTGVVDIL